MESENIEKKKLNFIEEIIEEDLNNNKHNGLLHFRFPPEPNGYLHIGHAKAICLNFGLAEKYNGYCNLRFDDTNPAKESVEYVESIKKDVLWLGFEWHKEPLFASDYFEQFYNWAIQLIKDDKAYVCAQTPEEIAEYKGTPTKAGKNSPYRNRSVEENLLLFEEMRAGKHPEGKYLLRAKIDMASPNMHMRDPILYRIKYAKHHRTNNDWCIYPMYDFAHELEDYIEGITHSLCTLEFEVHRPLYDWVVEQIRTSEYKPRQIEFARLNLNYTVMSKRKLLKLVENNIVDGWDDPRMPTISGLRRRGYTPESIRNFAEKVGIAKRENTIDIALLEYSIREHLNKTAQRMMGVIDPIKLIITNYPENVDEEFLEAVNNPEDETMGYRQIPFSKELYIEKSDFMENPPRKFFRLGIGREVRLRYAYFVTCHDVKKDDKGNIIEIYCTYDPASKGGKSPDGRKVKGTLHWVSAKHAVATQVNIYDRLFNVENPDKADESKTYLDYINPDSLEIKQGFIEPYIEKTDIEDKFQLERLGYFCVDKNSTNDKLIINRTVTLKDTWAKIANKK